LLDESLISPDNRDYINKHHAKCLEKLTPLLSGDDDDSKRALGYLKRQCAPLTGHLPKVQKDNSLLYAIGGLLAGAGAMYLFNQRK